jgi:hypothetical protein
MKAELRPYSGPHAGRLYHVVDSDTGAVIRNATPLEVELWERLQKEQNLAEVRARAVDEFIDQWNMAAGGDNDFVRFGYDYTDRLRQEAS